MGQEWMPAYGLSIACQEIPGEMPFEVSLTTRPSFSDAKVLAIGEAAMTTWNLLTEAPATANGPVRPGVDMTQRCYTCHTSAGWDSGRGAGGGYDLPSSPILATGSVQPGGSNHHPARW
jgi:hypothetical protein